MIDRKEDSVEDVGTPRVGAIDDRRLAAFVVAGGAPERFLRQRDAQVDAFLNGEDEFL